MNADEPPLAKQALVALCKVLGFAECRVAPATQPPHAEAFLQWLDDGRAGEMAWLERNRERRTTPDLVLPGAKSVITLAMNYWQGAEVSSPRPESGGNTEDGSDPLDARGTIARYAWNEDYHDLILPKLREIDAFLQRFGGTQRYYVDTGPVLERDFAAASGIGWHGKSTMLISPTLGTWFFLAELFTTLELAPDSPVPDRCGRCSRCMDACPTGAITSPHSLDARLCVAYLTIELKGSIPEHLRPLIGDRIYGCDECLSACPWNRFAQVSSEAAFQARDAVKLRLVDYLALDDDAFRRLFKDSPLKRIKRRGFLRNVCVALGNVGTHEHLPALERAAANPEPLIAEHAQWAIRQIRERMAKVERANPPT